MEGKACKSCLLMEPAPTIKCSVCNEWLHRACVSERLLRGNTVIVCKACKAANSELSDELLLPQAPPTRGNSTVVGGARPKLPTEMSLEQALHRVLELEERLKTQADMFQELMTKQFPQSLQCAVHTPGNVHGQSVKVNMSSLNASDTQSVATVRCNLHHLQLCIYM